MPRSADGRWTRQCQVCGESFQQRRTTQVTCSVACRGKLPHNTGGVRAKAGMQAGVCPTCGKTFTPVRDNQIACSRACYRKTPSWQESQRRNDANPGRRERQNERRQVGNNPARSSYNLRYNLKTKYGMTVEQYEEKLASQAGLCAVCGNPPKPGGVRAASRLHADHDHETGRNRELLCLNCNIGIGCFRDDPLRLRAAAEYIERHRSLEG